MVRKHNAPKKQQQMQTLLDESDVSDDDPSFGPRGSSSQLSQSQNSTRNSSRLTAQNQSTQSTSGRNQAGSSRGGRGQQQPTSSKNQATTSKGSSSAQQKATGAAKRKHKPTKNLPALQHIRYLQMHTENLIPKTPFCRVVKEVLQRHGDLRMTKESLEALQDAAEAYLIGLFGDAFRLTLHRNRVTIHPIDIQLLLYIRGMNDPGLPG